MRTRVTCIQGAAVMLLVSLSACGGSEGGPKGGPVADTEPKRESTADVINRISKVPTVTKVVKITEDNDPNDKIGRPGGYEAGAVFFDSDVEMCDPPSDPEGNFGVECGATLEVWPNAAAAKQRSDFIQDALSGANGVLGTEYHYQARKYLLRVWGDVKPSKAKAYEAAITPR